VADLGGTVKFGIVLPTYLYSEQRKQYAGESYASLMRTVVDAEDCKTPLFVIAQNEESAEFALRAMSSQFINPNPLERGFHTREDTPFSPGVWIHPTCVGGTDQSLCWGVEMLMDRIKEMTHFIYLTDDLLYNPMWFIELKALVLRHPDARAWSVYRSSYTRHHVTLRQEDTDHVVSSLSGNGTCMTVEEWKAWGVKSADGTTWPVPTGGNTLDLHHAYYRPGDRWALDVSYIQHIGKLGLRCTPDIPDFAEKFAGVE
jgi:hypothetical protein